MALRRLFGLILRANSTVFPLPFGSMRVPWATSYTRRGTANEDEEEEEEVEEKIEDLSPKFVCIGLEHEHGLWVRECGCGMSETSI